MEDAKTADAKVVQAWQAFRDAEQLTEEQVKQFELYLHELERWNEMMNITTIASEPNILAYHFQDSLAVGNYIPLAAQTICDVGSGGGFPGIPLKIKYPDLSVILLEVNTKKIAFLEHIIGLLGLENIQVCDYDWRSFLRKAPFPHIDFFMARASLKPDVLVKLFQPGYAYNKATLIYWASHEWEVEKPALPYIVRQETYRVGQKSRKFVFMGK